MATEVAFSDLNTWLQGQPDNTADTPYEITVTGLTTSNIGKSTTSGTLGYYIKNNSTKYVNLSTTEIPSGVTDMEQAFYQCVNLVASPVIPSGVTSLKETFYKCSSLVTITNIPNGITDLYGTFRECSSLTTIPELPNSLTALTTTFVYCTSLATAPVIPSNVTSLVGTFIYCTSLANAPVIPNGVTNMDTTFSNCTSLSVPPVIPNSVTNIDSTFEYSAITTMPAIPSGVTSFYCTFRYTPLTSVQSIPSNINNLEMAFQGCGLLVDAPIIPMSVTNMRHTFNLCDSLSHKPIIPVSVTDSLHCYDDVSTKNWKGTQSQANYFLSTFFQQTELSEIRVYNNDKTTFKYVIVNVGFTDENVDSYFEGLPSNTPYNPHRIYWRDINGVQQTHSIIKSICNYIPNINLDFRYTTLERRDNDYVELCSGCSNLIVPPVLAMNYNSISKAFMNCSRLKLITKLPTNTKNMSFCFKGCTGIVGKLRVIGKTTKGIAIYHGTNYATSGRLLDAPPPLLGNVNYDFSKTLSDTLGGKTLRNYYYKESDGYQLDENSDVGIFDLGFSKYYCGDTSSSDKFGGRIYLLHNISAYQSQEYQFMWQSDNTQTEVKMINAEYISVNSNGKLAVGSSVIYNDITHIYDSDHTDIIQDVFPADSTGAQIGSRILAVGEEIEVVGGGSSTEWEVLANDVVFVTTKEINCTNSKNQLPTTVTNLESTFESCTALTEAPVIPEGVTNLSEAFENCGSLENVPYIPSTVTSAIVAFNNCTSLKKIDEFKIPLATLKNNNYFMNMFSNCPSLETIGFKVEASTDWHAWRLKFDANSVEGKIFGFNNGQLTSTAVLNTQISKNDIRLPVLTDELWFPPANMSDSDVEDVIRSVLNNRYTYWNKAVIDPNSKSLVMMASDPNNVVSNFLNGGGGGGVEKLVISTTRSVNVTKDTRIFADGSAITITLNYGSSAEGYVAEVYAIQACTITYYTAQGTTTSLAMEAGGKAIFVYFSGWKLHSNYGTTNSVTVDNMQSVSSNAVAVAINDAFRTNLQFYTHFEWQGWTNSHSYTINLEGNYLLICANPNINSSAIYFIKGGHTTITSLVGYANTVMAPQNVGYNINVNRTSLTITGGYCTTALMQIGT